MPQNTKVDPETITVSKEIPRKNDPYLSRKLHHVKARKLEKLLGTTHVVVMLGSNHPYTVWGPSMSPLE